MKITIQHIILLFLLGPFPGTVSVAQDDGHSAPLEAIDFFTDRSIYISGENILFSAIIMTQNSPGEKALSKVLYVEMINQKNDQILGQKFLVFNAVSTGYIKVPLNLSTGIYYLKSYTKYMRNFGPGSFSYTKIRVLNPFESSIQIEDTEVTDHKTDTTVTSGVEAYDLFHIETDRAVYKQLDSISISIIPKIHRDSLKITCISVVPSHSGEPGAMIINGIEKQKDKFEYMPDYYGITLTGLLLDNHSNQPLPSTELELSILGDSSDFISVYTNSDGRFFFPLPRLTGQKTVFMAAERADSIIPSILVDNDFSPISINMPYQTFNLSENERVTALNLARNLQISEHFTSRSDTLANEPENHGDLPFYGTPTETLNIDDYVQLPTLEDYFNELPYLVKVRRLKGKKYLKMMGTSSGIQIFEPLVLVDMIAVHDMDAILSISSKHIAHIDIINETYVKGNMTYGGIVSIFSKNDDFAGIELPHSGIFIKYDFLAGSMTLNNSPGDSHIPDARNTLYWDGNFQLTSDTPREILFKSGHSRGQYDIVLQGVLNNGERFTQIATFRVE
ncbi:MAG: hypothetical protein AMS26_13855 [Bacteroides sp. SM23_62]|nr:MAG: hypothetical protein AMS26_13855 [Bacteroides sp. SM23_62]